MWLRYARSREIFAFEGDADVFDSKTYTAWMLRSIWPMIFVDFGNTPGDTNERLFEAPKMCFGGWKMMFFGSNASFLRLLYVFNKNWDPKSLQTSQEVDRLIGYWIPYSQVTSILSTLKAWV